MLGWHLSRNGLHWGYGLLKLRALIKRTLVLSRVLLELEIQTDNLSNITEKLAQKYVDLKSS